MHTFIDAVDLGVYGSDVESKEPDFEDLLLKYFLDGKAALIIDVHVGWSRNRFDAITHIESDFSLSHWRGRGRDLTSYPEEIQLLLQVTARVIVERLKVLVSKYQSECNARNSQR